MSSDTIHAVDKVMTTTCKIGDDYFSQAKKLYHKKISFNKKKDYQKAVDLFDDAARAYRNVHMNQESGYCYLAKAEVLLKLKDDNGASEAYADAADAFESMSTFEGVNTEKLIHALGTATRICGEQGKTNKAARLQKELAERLQQDLENKDALEASVQAYQKAIDYFSMDNSYAHMNECYEKMAIVYGYMENYKMSSRIWQKILFADWNKPKTSTGTKSMVQFKANKYIFKSILAQLAGLKKSYQSEDVDLVEDDFETLRTSFGYQMEKNREYDLLHLFITLVREKDIKKLRQAIAKSPELFKEDEYNKFMLHAIIEAVEKSLKNLDEIDLT